MELTPSHHGQEEMFSVSNSTALIDFTRFSHRLLSCTVSELNGLEVGKRQRGEEMMAGGGG